MLSQPDERAPARTSPKSALIVVDHVEKVYSNGTVALADISFEVPHGQFVSLVGPSGCGKSTLLRVIAGLGPITAGSVLVDGLTPKQSRQERSDTAFVFQDPTLMPWRTVLGNVELPLELGGISRSERRTRALEAIQTVGLDAFARAYPRELSGGMRMRASLARALVAQPRLLLMDEPFGALDEINRQHLNGELLRICALAGWTVVFVTHNVFEAVFLSHRILVMSKQPGRIVADVRVDLPWPRVPDLRASREYSRLVGDVVHLLGEGNEA